jgi:hypothetical protein
MTQINTKELLSLIKIKKPEASLEREIINTNI